MTAWAKISLILGAIIIVFGAGWTTKGKWDEAADASALQAEVTARIEAEKKAADISSSYEIQKTQNQQTIAQLLTEVKSHAKTSPACAIPSSLLYQIRSSTASSTPR